MGATLQGVGVILKDMRSDQSLFSKERDFLISLPFATYTLRPAIEDPLSASRRAVSWV